MKEDILKNLYEVITRLTRLELYDEAREIAKNCALIEKWQDG